MTPPPEKTIDYLLAGQGVAGTFLARALIERGRRVLVVDDDQRASSSRVAAGLLNPITGMRLHLAEGTDVLLAASKKLFARLEREHARPVFTPVPIRRLYDSEKEKALKARRAAEPRYAALMSGDDAPGIRTAGAALADAHGSFIIHGGGWVDLPLLLDLEAAWLRARAALISGQVHPDDLRPDGRGGVFWGGWHARHGVVFCNGYKAGQLPCWSGLPWQPAKGEIIDCITDAAIAPWILNRAGWAIPLGDGRWRSGSTWEWKQLDETPTPALGEQLLLRLQGFFATPLNARLISHRAGVRPCVLGNHPLCGTHPELPWLHLFGGLGPKGTFWGPACAEALADWLCEGIPLPPRIDLRGRKSANAQKASKDAGLQPGKTDK
ncbi:MAG: FAD-binding oxidoreductase [Puniceicoccales bacterium]|jgi:glycine/D-amino acid oxidase-like deaminating enzyme|nr:FAD-binding oxidoreductase [Puniceicoccales bacterium]